MGTNVGSFDDMPLRKLGKYFWLAWFTASMGQFVDAYDTLIIGAALIYLGPLWNLTASQTGLLASSAFIGVAIGAPTFGAFADRIGRRYLYMGLNIPGDIRLPQRIRHKLRGALYT